MVSSSSSLQRSNTSHSSLSTSSLLTGSVRATNSPALLRGMPKRLPLGSRKAEGLCAGLMVGAEVVGLRYEIASSREPLPALQDTSNELLCFPETSGRRLLCSCMAGCNEQAMQALLVRTACAHHRPCTQERVAKHNGVDRRAKSAGQGLTPSLGQEAGQEICYEDTLRTRGWIRVPGR